MRRGPSLVLAGLVVLLAGVVTSGAAQTPGPTRAVGRLIWRGIQHHDSDDPGRTWVTGQEAIIDLRLKLDTARNAAAPGETVWIDDGTTFRAQVAWNEAVPYERSGCTIQQRDFYWFRSARLDATDPATGWPTGLVIMHLPDDGGDAWMDLRLRGGDTALTELLAGADWCSELSGLQLLPFSSGMGMEAHPICPLAKGGAVGRRDASGTRLDFTCVDHQSGPTPDGARVRDLLRIDGSLRFLP
jgi:hypothetical protein